MAQDEKLVNQYIELFGEKPHHKLKDETIKQKIDAFLESKDDSPQEFIEEEFPEEVEEKTPEEEFQEPIPFEGPEEVAEDLPEVGVQGIGRTMELYVFFRGQWRWQTIGVAKRAKEWAERTGDQFNYHPDAEEYLLGKPVRDTRRCKSC